MSKLLNILNDMPPRQILMLSGGVAVVMFAILYLFLSLWTNSEQAEEEIIAEKPVLEMVNVVAAKSDISPRTMIKENMLQLKEVSADLVPDGAITSVAEVINTPARTTIFAGDILTEQKIYMDMSQAGFVGSIPSDCRAVSIDVNSVTSVDGFAKPGDYVDLLLVEKDDKSATTNVLLQNVLLLSINQNMTTNKATSTEDNENSNTTAINNPSIATFALKPEEAIQLISAAKLGEIYLMLRPFKPKDMYIDNLEYTAVSSNYSQSYNEPESPPAVSVPTQSFKPTPNPVTPSPVVSNIPARSSANVTNTPKNSSVPAEGTSRKKSESNKADIPKIEIIQGDKVVQKNDDTK